LSCACAHTLLVALLVAPSHHTSSQNIGACTRLVPCPCTLQVVKAKVPILKGSLWVNIPCSQLLEALAADNPAAAQQLSAAAAAAAAVAAAGDGGEQQQQLLRLEVQVDISIGVADSNAAVNYLQRQVRE
jgi:hypothetical protein